MFGDSNDWASIDYLSSNQARPTVIDASRVIRPQGSRPSSYAGSYGAAFERPSGAWVPKYLSAGATDASVAAATGGKVKYMISGLIGPLIVVAMNNLEPDTELQQGLVSQKYKNFKAAYKSPSSGDSAGLSAWEWLQANSTNKQSGHPKSEQGTFNVTVNGIRALQAWFGAEVDGVIGPDTYGKLGLPKPYGNPAKKSKKGSSSSSSSPAVPSQRFYQKTWFKVVGGIAFAGIVAAILFVPKKD